MLVLLLTACASVAVAEPAEQEYGDWGDLALRIEVLSQEGELIDTQPIITEPIITEPEEVVEPEAPIQDETPEEEPPATED